MKQETEQEISNMFEVSRFNIVTGEFENAIKLLTDIIEKDPFYLKAYVNRAHCYLETGEHDKALKDVNKAISVNPDFSPAYFKKGAYYFNKDTDLAIQNYSKVIELNNSKFTALAYAERAKMYYKQEMLENVFRDIESALEIEPDSAKFYSLKGTIKNDLGLYEDALIAYSKAAELDPENKKYCIEKIKINFLLKKYSNVINDYKKLTESEIENPVISEEIFSLKAQIAVSYCFIAKKYSKNEDYEEAFKNYDYALDVKPDFTVALYGKALLNSGLGNHKEALTGYYKVLETNPKDFLSDSHIFRLIAETYEKLKDYDNAVKFFTKLINLSPEVSENYRLRASAYIETGEYDKAAEDFNKAVESDPDEVRNYFERGRFNFFKNKDFEKVISDYLKIPEDFYFLFEVKRLLGYSYFFVNKLNDALKTFEDALKIKPDSDEIKEQIEKIRSMVRSEKIKNLRKITELMISGNEQATDFDEIPEGHGEFGLSATNPVPVKGMSGNIYYLGKLTTIEGDRIEYKRLGSTEANNIKMPVDIYEISVNGKSLTKIYISPYHKRISEKAPKGFMFIGDNLANIKNFSLN